jgi:dihydroflavonol-4-reductase
MANPIAFVTGATGFLGRHLVEQLCAAGWQVTCFHRASSDTSALQPLKVILKAGTLHDPVSVAAAMPEGAVVFHVAANTSSWSRNNAEQARDNVDGARAVVLAALERKAQRMVHVSTWNVWGYATTGVRELTETAPMAAKGSWINYDKTKWQAEQEVRTGIEQGLDAVIVNPPHIMGKYDTVNWARLIKMASNGTLPGVPPGRGTFVSGAEVARALITAAQRGRKGENYLLPGADATFLDVVTIVGRLAGRKQKVRVLPVLVLRLLAQLKALGGAITGKEPDITPEAVAMVAADCVVKSSKAEEELGFRRAPLEELVEESWRWLGESGRL